MRSIEERVTDEPMDWKSGVSIGAGRFGAIRVPHDKRSKEAKIAESRKGGTVSLLLRISLHIFTVPIYSIKLLQ
jgi:hypothetical protein